MPRALGGGDEPTESEREKTLAGSTKRRLFGNAGGKGKSGVGRKGRNGEINETNGETEKKVKSREREHCGRGRNCFNSF